MRLFRPAVFVPLALLIAGCVTSEQPLYTPKNLVSEPAFAGKWVSPQVMVTVTIKQAPGKAYGLTITRKEELPLEDKKGARRGTTTRYIDTVYKAYLLRLGPTLFLDTQPAPWKKAAPGRQSPPATHSLWKVSLTRDSLTLSHLNGAWVGGLARKKQLPLAHRWTDRERNVLFLTASTRDLQRFLTKQVNNPQAFPPGMHLTRAKQ